MPRIIALDQEEEIPLGDREELIELVDDVDEQNELGQEEVEVMLTGRALQKSLARNNRKQKVRDLLLWGIQGHDELDDGEVVGDTNEEEDEDLISILTMFLEEGDEWERQQEVKERLRKNRGVQSKVSDWFKVTRIERKRKVEPEKAVTKELKQTTLWQCLEGKR